MGIPECLTAEVGDHAFPKPRTLLDVVLSNAHKFPEKIWASVPNSQTDPAEGYRDLTYMQLHNAVNRSAWWLAKKFQGETSREFEPLAYIGTPDTRYVIFTLAAIKAGFQMLFLSPRNSDEAQWSVLQQAACSNILHDAQLSDKIRSFIGRRQAPDRHEEQLEDLKVQAVQAPEEEDLLCGDVVPEFPYDKTPEVARLDPLVTLHTSSTTGLPKTISLTQGYGFHEDSVLHLPKSHGLDIITRKPFYGSCRMFVAMPLFHAGGVLLCLLKAIYHDIVIVHQPEMVPLSASIVNGILHAGGCNGCVLPPSLAEDMLPVPEYFDTLASLDFVQFGSGPMSKASGDRLLSRQRNCPHFIGSSEVGLLPLLELEDPVEDWQYFHFHPWGGIDMRPIEGGDDTLRQLFINRVANEMGLQPVFELFPEIEEWDTRELYSRHPTKPYLWRCIGRADDIIVLSNGEKLNPSDTEGILSNCIPDIKGALVVGSGYFMPGLILETANCNPRALEERKRLLDGLRPTLAAVNERAPKHGQLMELMIHFTTADKPFFRTPKLSVIRQKTVESFSDEITQMYARQKAQSVEDALLPASIDLTTDASTQEFFVGIIMRCTGWDREPQPDEDLFLLGLDSLHVMRLVRATTVALGRERSSTQLRFDSRIVYENLSVKKLSKALQSLLSQGSSANGRQEVSETLMEEEIDVLVEKTSTFDWDSTTFDKLPVTACSESTVVLTGSTGSFGTYLLSVLVNDASVRRIYCLDRAADAEARHIKSLGSQGLPCDLRVLKEKVVFLKTSDLSSPCLGLNQHRYETLTQTVSHVVHNAWPVNFNLSLESFTRSINGVQRLVEFCVSTKNTSKLAFVSSISSVARCKGTVPSAVVQDSSVAGKMGYAQSKHTAERILLAATERSTMLSQYGTALQTVVLRVGQIAGPVVAPHGKGVWTTREWFPRLVISSKMIDALPKTLGRMDGVDWIPIDLLAKAVGELVGLSSPTDSQDSQDHSSTHCTEVYNLVNPTTVSAKELLPTVKERLGITNMVSLSDWIDRVRGWPAEEDIPAAKILDFYESIVLPEGEDQQSKTFDVGNAVASSKTVRELSPVTEQWVAGWLQQWGF